MNIPSKFDILTLGPLIPLMEDSSVTQIMVNDPKHIYIERRGVITQAEIEFENNEHILRILQHILAPLGYRIDANSPIVDTSLPDGTRLVAVVPPVAPTGPTLTIRKFSKTPLKIEDLIRFGAITPEIGEFIRACIVARLNIVVSGGLGSGKVSLLNALSSFIPDDERIVIVERYPEIQLTQSHIVNLVARPTNAQGKGQVSFQELIAVAMSMRPDRLVFGECLGSEALDIIQAINLGHDGAMTAVNSNTPRHCLTQLEKMCLISDVNLPVQYIREQIATAIDLIVQVNRLRDGSRKITYVTEVQGMEQNQIMVSDVFIFEQTSIERGKVIGRIRPTGTQPTFMELIKDIGVQFTPDIFHYSNRRNFIPQWFKKR